MKCRVAEPVPKRIKRLASEVSVGSVCHSVIFKVRQLVHSGVERKRQSSSRIVLTAQCVGNRRSTFFTWIPCFKNGVGVGVDPVDSQRAAIHKNHGEWLARGSYPFNQFLFRRRKIDAGAISAKESWLGHRHLLTLQRTRNAHNRDHHVSILCGCQCFGRRRVVHLGPNQLRVRSASHDAVVNGEGHFLALFQVNAAHAGTDFAAAEGALPPACHRP